PVRHAHAGEQHARKLFRRERYRHTNHRAKYSRLAQPVPERRSLAHSLDARATQRHCVLANLQTALRPFDFRRRKIREIVTEIARQKIVNIMLAWIYSSHER